MSRHYFTPLFVPMFCAVANFLLLFLKSKMIKVMHTFRVTGGTVVKNLPANAEDASDASSVSGLGSLLEKETASHSSILAWEIPWTEKPERL